MTKDRKRVSYLGERVYVGIDVHKKSITVAVQTTHRVYRPIKMSPYSAKSLSDYLRSNFPEGEYLCAYEAGFSGFVLSENLKEEGIECLVVNAADIPTSDKDTEFKTDGRDASKIAASLKSGELQGIYIPSKAAQGDRSLARLHDQFKRDLVRQKCRIKMYLYYFGMEIPAEYDGQGRWSRPFISWLYNLELPTEESTSVLRQQMGQMIYVLGMKRNTESWLRSLGRSDRYAAQSDLLQTVPGFGKLRAIKFLLQLGDISRFKSLDSLCNYVGLVPSSNNSGDRVRQSRLTRRGHTQLRVMMVEAAWVSIGVDPALSRCYESYKKRMIGQKAIIRIARKLLSRIRYILKHKIAYEKGILA